MSLRERIEAALRLQPVDRVPFTCYEGLLPRGLEAIEGLGMVRTATPYTMATPNVSGSTETLEDGTQVSAVHTPVGTLTQHGRPEPGYGSFYKTAFYVKQPADYELLASWMDDTRLAPAHEAWVERRDDLGDRGVILASLPRAPFQRLWIEFTGIERLSYDLHDCPRQVERALEAITRVAREAATIIAAGPAEFVWLPDNITGNIAGHRLFAERLAPYYAEMASILRPAGKRLVSHMDGMMRALKGSVADTDIDIIEAFTPPPDGNLPLDEAREAWPGKAVWINFPSSVHWAEPERVKAATRELVAQGTASPGLAISITENIPAQVGTRSLEAIAQALAEG